MRVNYDEYIQTAEWRQRAEAAKQRAGNRCQICNRPAPRVTLEAHHRTYERLGHELPEDLTVLCRGCHELYEANRRIPRPPQVQPVQLPPQEAPTSPMPQPQPGVPPAKRRTPFAPATKDHQQATLQAYKFAIALAHQVDPVYALAPDEQTDQPNYIYALTLDEQAPLPEEQGNQPVPSGQNGYRPHRSRQVGLAALVVLLLLILLAWVDFRQQAFLSLLQPDPTPTHPPVTTTHTPAPTPTTNVATATALPTLAPPTPTLAPTPQPFTPTPIYVDTASPALTPETNTKINTEIKQRIVNQTALVCGNPCTCAPVVRTITSGTAVSVLETLTCRGDTWSKIADGEWLGPRLLDDGAVATTAVP